MNRRKLTWVAIWATLLTVVAVAAPAFPAFQQVPEVQQAVPDPAQADPGAPPPVEGEPTPVEGEPTPAEGELPTQGTVETILRQQEQVVRGPNFSYLAQGRRDPFQSLMTPAVKVDERPPGVAGMLVAELDLAGIVRDTGSGDVALLIGSDNKGYFLRIGDEVFDGTVIAVDADQGTVTFRQQVDDPRLIKPYRDVQKRLVPEEGTK